MTDDMLWRGYVKERGLVCADMHVVKEAFMRGLKIGRGDEDSLPEASSRLKDRLATESRWLRNDATIKDILPESKWDERITEFEKRMRMESKTHYSIQDLKAHFINWLNLRNERDVGTNKHGDQWRDETLDRMRRLVNTR